MATLPGWQRVTRNTFLDPEGNAVSRRQYDNARARSAGFNNYEEYRRATADPVYATYLDSYVASSTDTYSSARRVDSDFNRAWARFQGDIELAQSLGLGNDFIRRLDSPLWDLAELSGFIEDASEDPVALYG